MGADDRKLLEALYHIRNTKPGRGRPRKPWSRPKLTKPGAPKKYDQLLLCVQIAKKLLRSDGKTATDATAAELIVSTSIYGAPPRTAHALKAAARNLAKRITDTRRRSVRKQGD